MSAEKKKYTSNFRKRKKNRLFLPLSQVECVSWEASNIMAAKNIYSDETENKHDRFLDAGQEPRRMLQPVEGYQKMPLVTLEQAVESIVFCCPDINRRAFIAMSNAETPADGLDQNESASIFLYTMEWTPRDECLYYVLNQTLRTENRQKLKPWYSYLKLILTALHKLPPQKQTIWRGVTLDLSQQYEVGKRYVWWAFSSCTRSLAVLEANQFLGKHGSRTLFNIECQNGKTIRSHSYINVEDEILLLPATQFEVVSKLKPSSDLYIIHLKQVDPPFPLIELPFATMTAQPTSDAMKNEKQLSNNYRNEKLEQLISQCPLKGKVELGNQELTDNDIPIIIQLAIIDKQCFRLDLMSNMIANEGAQHLARILQSNTSLQILDLSVNQITDDGVRWIAEALHTNTTLILLALGKNQITDKGVRLLSESLQANSTLAHLYLYHNSLGDNGIRHVAQALTQNTTLKVLSLGITGLTDNGVTYLGEMLKKNATLITLNLDHNPLTNKGLKIIFDALCGNDGLQQLNIKCRVMTGECVSDIQNMFKRNDTLIELNVLKVSFTDPEQDQLRTMATTKQTRQIHFEEK
jgi:Ran GTPase-activating protein (RanGAP) involved in mRNA processing and transport